MALATRDSSVMRSKRCCAIQSAGAIQDPPHAITRLNARYEARLLAFTPPVGMKSMSLYGAAIALRYGRPPIGSAGKNFTTRRPRFRAVLISVGVHTPG